MDVFLQERKNGIGGSDVAAIVGISPFANELDVYNDKVLEKEDENVKSESMYWGSRLEPVILEEYQDRTKSVVSEKNSLFMHDSYDFLRGHVDGIVNDGEKILEIKTVGAYSRGEWGESGTDEIPQYYVTQLQHYCNITKIQKVDVAVLFGGNNFEIYHYLSNKKLGGILEKKCIQFWNDFVVPKIPPVEPHKIVVSSEKSKEATSEIIDCISEYKKLSALIREMDVQKNLHKERIKQFMHDAGELKFMGGVLASHKRQSREGIDLAYVKENYPEIYEESKKLSSFNVLRIK